MIGEGDGSLVSRLPKKHATKKHAKHPHNYGVRYTDGETAFSPLARADYVGDREWAIERKRSGQVRSVRFTTRPKSRTMRITRQLGLPSRYRPYWNLATLEYSMRRRGRDTEMSECATSSMT